MAYNQYNRSLGILNANADVVITEYSTGSPAIILSTLTGGVISSEGRARLDSIGNLSVIIDTARQWVISIQESPEAAHTAIPASYVVLPQGEIETMSGRVGIIYVSDIAPQVSYYWDGIKMVRHLSLGEVEAVNALVNGTFVNGVYDSNGRLINYIRQGVRHNIAYPNSFTAIISNELGNTRTVTFDSNGRVSSIL